jgi:histidyl-tRNA synthetase
MAKITNISGFPEWLPEQKMAEDVIIARVKGIYERAGFVPIETPAAELLETLGAKGVIDKELYVIKRAQGSENDDEHLALHFDLTVPCARYVAQHYNDLIFPFKRYQVQKVWRGDRPQKGRFREFYQFDIDIIARDDLPLSCDAEVISLLDAAFAATGLGEHQIKLNNRKLLMGYYEELGLGAIEQKKAITVVDKVDKIGRDNVRAELINGVGLTESQADKIVALTLVKVSAHEAVQRLREISCTTPAWQEGIREMEIVLSLLSTAAQKRVLVDLSLARGLDYYTGSIFEVVIPARPEYGSVGSGGRYDDLASEFINKKLPGVGASFGLTRVMDLMFASNLLDLSKRTAAEGLIAVFSEEQRIACNALADQLRSHGIGVEVFFKSPKIGKQIEYAEKKGMRYVFFISEGGAFEVKDLTTKVQTRYEGVQQFSAGRG